MLREQALRAGRGFIGEFNFVTARTNFSFIELDPRIKALAPRDNRGGFTIVELNHDGRAGTNAP